MWQIDGSRDPDVLIVGHSHILAMLAGYTSREVASRSVQFGFMHSEDRTKWPQVNDHYWDTAARSTAPTIAIVWNGNQHNAHFLLQTEPPLRLAGTVLSNYGNHDGMEAIVVSPSMFEELWQPDFASLEEVVKKLSCVKRCMVVGTPPPKDEVEIREHLKSDEYFIQRARDMDISVESLKVSNNEFRVALWQQIQDGLARVANQTGIEFVPVAPSCLTSSSLLAKGLGAPDATHANGIYGVEILRAIEEKWMEWL